VVVEILVLDYFFPAKKLEMSPGEWCLEFRIRNSGSGILEQINLYLIPTCVPPEPGNSAEYPILENEDRNKPEHKP
jgi:hypothetical protein